MEALSQSLQPYKNLVGQVASIVTIGQFLSGVLLCKDIYNKKTTKDIPATPFIGGIVVGLCMLKYGILLSDPAMLQVNIAAIFLNVLYTVFYYQYSTNKWDEVLKPLSIGSVLVAIFLGYAELEDVNNVEYRYGLIVTILMLLLMGAPLMNLREIIQKKDASSIPLPITATGAIVSCLWFLYGIILLNDFMIVQNLIGFSLCAVQLILFAKYPAKETSGGQNTKRKNVKKDL